MNVPLSRVPRHRLALAAACLASVLVACAYGAEEAVVLPPAAVDNPKEPGAAQTAVLAAGCFWGVQGVYEHVRGVMRVVSGYTGGSGATAQYETVSRGNTGHAESVKITFDPAQISYGQILQIAFSVVHDPTELNRQGPDVGSQYRSAIFLADDTQKHIAESYIAQLNGTHAFAKPIVTHLEPLRGFFEAETYHQDFLVRHPTHPYIAYNDLPKVESLKRVFPELYRDDPVLVNAR